MGFAVKRTLPAMKTATTNICMRSRVECESDVHNTTVGAGSADYNAVGPSTKSLGVKNEKTLP